MAREVYPTFLPGAGLTEANGDSLNETMTKGGIFLVFLIHYAAVCPVQGCPAGSQSVTHLAQTQLGLCTSSSTQALPPGMSDLGGLAAPSWQDSVGTWGPWVALEGGSLWRWFSHPGSGAGAAPSMPALAWTLCGQTLTGHLQQGPFDQPLPLKVSWFEPGDGLVLWESGPDASQHPHGQSHPRQQEPRRMQRPAQPFWM